MVLCPIKVSEEINASDEVKSHDEMKWLIFKVLQNSFQMNHFFHWCRLIWLRIWKLPHQAVALSDLRGAPQNLLNWYSWMRGLYMIWEFCPSVSHDVRRNLRAHIWDHPLLDCNFYKYCRYNWFLELLEVHLSTVCKQTSFLSKKTSQRSENLS